MSYLPAEHKHLIQTSYVRFRELIKELSVVQNKITMGQFAHWGGLAVVAFGLIRTALGRPGISAMVGGTGLICFVFGWAYKSGEKAKEADLFNEQVEIQEGMNKIGVTFQDAVSGEPAVYVGDRRVAPLLDDSYR